MADGEKTLGARVVVDEQMPPDVLAVVDEDGLAALLVHAEGEWRRVDLPKGLGK